ncbi:MAG: hypothetical protein M0P26_00130 [Bacteroidales bacterium]|nr:hypothetical protein [Bacteroidales bacterium]
MVEEFNGWKTKYGSLHATEEAARKAEQEEKLAEFSNELRVILCFSPGGWDSSLGPDWAQALFNRLPSVVKLCNKYNE